MKIAIPVKMNRENPPLAPLFGKAKWYAIVSDGNISIEANPAEGGTQVVEWLSTIGVDTIIMQEMGQGPYGMVKKLGTIEVYHSGYERTLLEDTLTRLQEGNLQLLDDTAMADVIAHHEMKHSHDHHGHGHADHHHH